MNEITPRAAMELACHEGLVREAYKDSVGVWTWSIGITSASGHDVKRYIGNPQSLEKCLDVWAWTLENYADAVRKAFAGHDLTEEQFAAALSFHYNTGAIGRASWVKHWKSGDVAKARKAIMNWSKPPEIIPRRKAERALFFDGQWSGDGTVTEYTQVIGDGFIQWGSAKKTDITDALHKAMGKTEANPKDPVTPTGNAKGGIIAVVLAILAAIAAKLADLF